MTAFVVASMTVRLPASPFAVKMRFEKGSYAMESGLFGTGIFASTFNDDNSKTVTVFASPSLVKPLFIAGASATPCTPAVPLIDPTMRRRAAS